MKLLPLAILLALYVYFSVQPYPNPQIIYTGVSHVKQ